MSNTKVFQLAALFAVLAAGSAHAHATFTSPTVTAESYAVIELQIPHGCDGKATNEVHLKLPEGFVFAKPQPKAGWELEIIRGEYEKSYDDHGTAVNAGPVEIRWKGGELPDEFYDTFVVRGKVSGVAADEKLAFPTTQFCGSDATVAWTDIADEGVDPHSLESPAPVLTVAAKATAKHGSHGSHGSEPQAAASVMAGDLQLEDAFTKAMLPGQPVGGGFVTVHNGGSQDDRLVKATSPVADRVELHEMAMQGDVMKMRKLDTGIVVPAGGAVELKPGGLHLMFMDVKTPFKEGDSVPVTLTFETAGDVEIMLPVRSASPAGHDHH